MDSGLGNDLVDMVGDLSEDEEYGDDDYSAYGAGQRWVKTWKGLRKW